MKVRQNRAEVHGYFSPREGGKRVSHECHTFCDTRFWGCDTRSVSASDLHNTDYRFTKNGSRSSVTTVTSVTGYICGERMGGRFGEVDLHSCPCRISTYDFFKSLYTTLVTSDTRSILRDTRDTRYNRPFWGFFGRDTRDTRSPLVISAGMPPRPTPSRGRPGHRVRRRAAVAQAELPISAPHHPVDYRLGRRPAGVSGRGLHRVVAAADRSRISPNSYPILSP